MKQQLKDIKDNLKPEDDSLFGLLSANKRFNTYFRILANNDNNEFIIQMTDNPKYWPKISEENYNGFRLLKRSEIKTEKLSVKYLSPKNLIEQLGPYIGLKIPESQIKIENNLETSRFYSIIIQTKLLDDIITCIEKIIDLTPQKKYEFIEKSLAEDIKIKP